MLKLDYVLSCYGEDERELVIKNYNLVIDGLKEIKKNKNKVLLLEYSDEGFKVLRYNRNGLVTLMNPDSAICDVEIENMLEFDLVYMSRIEIEDKNSEEIKEIIEYGY